MTTARIHSERPDMTLAEYKAWRRTPAVRAMKLRLFDTMKDGQRILGASNGSKPFFDTGLPESAFCFVRIV